MVFVADGQAGSRPLTAAFILLILVAGAVYMGTLISIITSPNGKGMKFAWAIFVFIAPLLGVTLWFLVGRRHARSSPATF
ncbi:hypothetical protein DMH15_02850 [Streptomyces sp. WAC 06725]|nr:hypothetical protein DMH15_02850 [Streptomyces sp. WAC 06725]